MDIDTLLNVIEAQVPDVTDTLYLRAANYGMRRFFRETEVWVRTLDSLSLRAGRNRYELITDEDISVVKFRNVYCQGAEIYSAPRAVLMENKRPYMYDREGRNLLLFPTPTSDVKSAITVAAVLMPASSMVDVPEDAAEFVDKYERAVVAAAVQYLVSMPSKRWTSNINASVQETFYQDAIIEAKREARGFNEKRIIISQSNDY